MGCLNVRQDFPEARLGILELRGLRRRLLPHARERLPSLVHLALRLCQLGLRRFQLRASCTLLLGCLLAQFDCPLLQELVLSRSGGDRAVGRGHAAGGGQQGHAAGTGEGRRRQLVHGASQLSANLLGGDSVAVVVIIEPVLPCSQHLHDLLVGQPRVLHPHERFFPSQGLLELLPVLFSDGLAAHRMFLPLGLQRMALIPQDGVEGLIRERQLRAAGHLSPGRECAEHRRGSFAKLVRQLPADRVLHRLPGPTHIQNPVVVQRHHKLPQKLDKGEAAERLPANRLRVCGASSKHLLAELLHSGPKDAAEGSVLHGVHLPELRVGCGWGQSRTASVPEELQEALSDLTRGVVL
mmetsp:Transcript_95019/g.301492  ORF Transcript_95019/g.301492 Transcript_95019/m.301492 type:complete len:353 (+) Transcript_95019:795-1853(+)